MKLSETNRKRVNKMQTLLDQLDRTPRHATKRRQSNGRKRQRLNNEIQLLGQKVKETSC